jgi:hypothetical protein
MTKNPIPPSLKSASGAGFTFEDKVAALLLCEMLAGRESLGNRFGVIEKLERQAVDWEPFGDFRLTVPNIAGKLVRCGGSAKSNRQVNSNGCTGDLCAGLWATRGKTVFVQGEDVLAIFCSTLSHDVHQHLHSLCNQAAESDPLRLDQKVIHAEARKIYDSFRNPNDNNETGLPGHVLARLVPREFDFEDNASRDEAVALDLCREALSPDTATGQNATDLWDELLQMVQTLRITGGEITREKLTAKLRIKFRLRDDPFDIPAWARIRDFSKAWLNEIDTTLPGGLTIPRIDELQSLRANLEKGRAMPVLGETGSGKSASVKMVGTELEQSGVEVVWIKSERFAELLKSVPNFIEVCRRTRKNNGFLVFDALEGCYEAEALKVIAQAITELASTAETPWQIILICQTPEWSRVVTSLTNHLATGSVMKPHFEFAELSKNDFALVCAAHPSVARLSNQAHQGTAMSGTPARCNLTRVPGTTEVQPDIFIRRFQTGGGFLSLNPR